MKRLRFLLLSLVCAMSNIGLQAQTFESDGINYTVCWSWRFSDAVYVTKAAEGSKYSGDIKIPRKVSYNNEEYWLVGVGNEAFKDCTEMTSCVFEGTIEWIGNNAFEGCTGLKEFTIPSYWSDDVYEGYVYLGYRAFWGCHLVSLTCMNGNPPLYNYSNPSWSAGMSYPVEPNWIGWDEDDRWHYNNTTTLYVPVGTIEAYSEKSEGSSYRENWGDYFTVIKEWGVEEDDSVPGLYEDIDVLKPLCDNAIIRILMSSRDAYDYLTNYIYETAEQGGDISALQALLDASFETVVLSGYGWIVGSSSDGWIPYKVIPKHKSYIQYFQNILSEPQEKLEKMQEKRIAYYQARRAGDSSADSMREELAAQAAEVEELINQIKQELEAPDTEAIYKDGQEFIDNFKSTITSVTAVSSDSRDLTPQWYSIKGQRLLTTPTKKGIYIRNGKKVTVK